MAAPMRLGRMVLRNSLTQTGLSQQVPCLGQAWRGMSDKMTDKGRGDERVHFAKEDERVLRELLKKMKAQADADDTTAAADVKASELKALDAIVGKYKMSEEDLQKLVEWRHS